MNVHGLKFVTSRSLDAACWHLSIALPSGTVDSIPAPGPVLHDCALSQDGYLTLSEVQRTAEWLANRWVQASPRPRSVAMLAGWENVRVTDPRLAELRARYLDALRSSRAATECHNKIETPEVYGARRARERALFEYEQAWKMLQRESVIAWQRRRHAELTRHDPT